MTLFERLKKEALYAQRSYSECLLYEVKGKASIAYKLGGITWDECSELNDMTARFMNTNRDYIAHQSKEFLKTPGLPLRNDKGPISDPPPC